MLHARNYFSATNCFCVAEIKISFCQRCIHWKNQLSRKKIKICFSESDIEKWEFETLPIETYLDKKITVIPFFSFDEQNEVINTHLYNPICGDLVYSKETDWLFFDSNCR